MATRKDPLAMIDMTPSQLALIDTVAEYISEALETKKDYALELGAGKGALSMALGDQFDHIDLQDVAYTDRDATLSPLPDHYQRLAIAFMAQNENKTYDCIYSTLFLHHMKDKVTALAKMSRLLKKGGKLFLCDLYVEDGRFHPDGIQGIYHHGFDPDVLANILKNNGCSVNNIETIFTLNRDNRTYPLFMIECTKTSK